MADYKVSVLSNSDTIRDIIISYLPDNFEYVGGLKSNLVIAEPCEIIKLVPQPVIIAYKDNEFMKMLNIWTARNNNNTRTNYITVPFYKENLYAKIKQLHFII